MKKINISAFIFDILLSCIGTFGIVSIPLTCILPEVSLWFAGILSLIASIIFVSIFNLRRQSAMMWIGIVIVGTMAYVLLNFNSIYRSFTYVMIQAVDIIRKNSGSVISLDIVNNNLDSGYLFEYSLLVVFVIIVGLVTAIEVSYIRGMVGAIIIILPMLVLFITYAVIPDSISFTSCILYVFGTATYKKGSESSGSGYLVIIIGIAALLFISMFVPKKGFERREIFNSMYVKLESLMSGTGENLFGVHSAGGINYGQLGKIPEVKFTDSQMATVTTIETGRNQYFKTFVGITYNGNEWSGNTDGEKESVTEKLINMADSNLDVQQYLTSGYTDNYFDMVKKYQYILYDDTTKKSYTETNYSIMHIDYARFKNIADRNVVFNTNYQVRDADIPTQDEFSRIERTYRSHVQDRYIYISDDTRKLVMQMLGSVNITSIESKMEYIEAVKKFLNNNYTYTVNPGKVPEEKDFLEYFLKENKKGYCTYFATAATVMFRYAGIPARYCEGYVVTNEKVVEGSRTEQEITRLSADGPHKKEINTAYTLPLTDRNAHAWVEVYMDGYGWISVEVTPGTGNADSMTEAEMIVNVKDDSSVAPGENTGGSEETTSPDSQERTTKIQTETLDTMESEETEMLPDNTSVVTNSKSDRIFTAIAFVFLGIAAALLIINLRMRIIIKNRKKYMKNTVAVNREEQMAYLYEYMLKLLRLLGYDKPKSMDYEEFAAHLEEQDELLRKCEIRTIMELLLKGSLFSQTSLSDEELMKLNVLLHKLRAAVKNECTGMNQIKFKYIDVL